MLPMMDASSELLTTLYEGRVQILDRRKGDGDGRAARRGADQPLHLSPHSCDTREIKGEKEWKV